MSTANLIIFVLLGLVLSGCGSSDHRKDAEFATGVGHVKSEESQAIEKLDRIATGKEDQSDLAVHQDEIKPEKQLEPLIEEVKKEKIHWGYKGSLGAKYWGGIDEKFVLCSQGKQQSPIDLKWKKPSPNSDLKFDYRATSFEVIDNGHSIEVQFASGSYLNIGSKTYPLKQLHFHSESEHSLSGVKFPLEMHLVHETASKELAVVAVFFKTGLKNEDLAILWRNIPTEKNKLVPVKGVLINPMGLLPKVMSFYRYQGSLTTPPCSEGVIWNVLNTPVDVGPAQMQNFNQFYKGNFRPIQPINDRQIINF